MGIEKNLKGALDASEKLNKKLEKENARLKKQNDDLMQENLRHHQRQLDQMPT